MRPSKLLIAVATITSLSGAVVARADDSPPELFRKNGCMSCHAVDHKVIGPAYKDVAARYKTDADALTKLTKKVKEGGGGNWGPAKMTPHPNISDEDLKTMVQWVLAR